MEGLLSWGLTFTMLSAVCPVNEVDLEWRGVPGTHHDIPGLQVPVAALLMHLTQGLHGGRHTSAFEVQFPSSISILTTTRLRQDAGMQQVADVPSRAVNISCCCLDVIRWCSCECLPLSEEHPTAAY